MAAFTAAPNTGGSALAADVTGPATVAPWMELSAPLAQDSSFMRLWRGFAAARIAIAAVLLALLLALATLATPSAENRWLIGLLCAYLAATLAVRSFMQPRPADHALDAQWLSTIGVDLLVYSALQFLQAGGISYSPLFAVPVLMASVLGPALLAFATAAAVTLLLLAGAWLAALQAPIDTAHYFLQAGLTGTGYFALAFLANQLAVRLAREEVTSRRSQKAARMQAQVNELVIQTLTDGVLVVDPLGNVHAANPAARLLLGCGDVPPAAQTFALTAQPYWQPLMDMAQLTFSCSKDQLGEVAIEEDAAQRRRVFVRTRLTAPDDPPGDGLCVIFLEDLREMEARLRAEKLGAMGRMSAAVAHEIRNPLAAITQANALLEEDLTDPGHRQLSGLVRQNAQRLARIVEEILDVSRVQPQAPATEPALLELDSAVAAACEDWTRQTGGRGRLQLSLQAGSARVPFEADHLRRVLVNLLDNALRYAGSRPDSIRVATVATAAQAGLLVWSDGAPLEQTVQRHLFEPFFSSESRSSGLGLYICRELCDRHGALIGYRRSAAPGGRTRHGNEFFVSFRPAASRLSDRADLTQ